MWTAAFNPSKNFWILGFESLCPFYTNHFLMQHFDATEADQHGIVRPCGRGSRCAGAEAVARHAACAGDCQGCLRHSAFFWVFVKVSEPTNMSHPCVWDYLGELLFGAKNACHFCRQHMGRRAGGLFLWWGYIIPRSFFGRVSVGFPRWADLRCAGTWFRSLVWPKRLKLGVFGGMEPGVPLVARSKYWGISYISISIQEGDMLIKKAGQTSTGIVENPNSLVFFWEKSPKIMATSTSVSHAFLAKPRTGGDYGARRWARCSSCRSMRWCWDAMITMRQYG